MAMGRPEFLTILTALALCGLPKGASLAWAAAPDPSGQAFVQRLGSQTPLGTAFTDQTGAPTTLGAAMAGRPTVLQLGYFACPALCGLSRDGTLAALAGSGLQPGTDYRFVFVAIDPAETPAAAAALASD